MTRFVGVKTCACGKTFTVARPADMPRRRFCSKRCAWDAKMTARPSDRTGRARAERAFPGQPCEVCGMPYGGRGRVQRHHIDSDRGNNDRSNIAFLCVQHHNDAHRASDGAIGGGARPRVTAMMHDRAKRHAADALAMRRRGSSIDEIAEAFGVHPYSVKRWFRKYRAEIAA